MPSAPPRCCSAPSQPPYDATHWPADPGLLHTFNWSAWAALQVPMRRKDGGGEKGASSSVALRLLTACCVTHCGTQRSARQRQRDRPRARGVVARRRSVPDPAAGGVLGPLVPGRQRWGPGHSLRRRAHGPRHQPSRGAAVTGDERGWFRDRALPRCPVQSPSVVRLPVSLGADVTGSLLFRADLLQRPPPRAQGWPALVWLGGPTYKGWVSQLRAPRAGHAARPGQRDGARPRRADLRRGARAGKHT